MDIALYLIVTLKQQQQQQQQQQIYPFNLVLLKRADVCLRKRNNNSKDENSMIKTDNKESNNLD